MNAAQILKIGAALLAQTAKLASRDREKPARYLKRMDMDHHSQLASGQVIRKHEWRDKSMSARQWKRKNRATRRRMNGVRSAQAVLGANVATGVLGPARTRRVMRHIEVPDFLYFKGRPDDLRARGKR